MKQREAGNTLILGGSGKTGRRVAARLRARGRSVRVGSRKGTPPFDWNDQTSYVPVLEGAVAAYIAYYPDLAVPGAAEHVRHFAELAVKEGVEQVVLLAGRGEPQVHPAEEAVRGCGARFTILRCAFFAQNFSEGLLAPRGGEIAFPAGSVTEPFIDVEDIADVAVAVLTQPGHDGNTYDLTGPRLLSFDMAAQEIARASGRATRYVPVTIDDYARLLATELGPDEVAFFSELFEHLLDGHNSHVSSDVSRVLGRPARDFADFARNAAASGAWANDGG